VRDDHRWGLPPVLDALGQVVDVVAPVVFVHGAQHRSGVQLPSIDAYRAEEMGGGTVGAGNS
jgi:hypothetical protein